MTYIYYIISSKYFKIASSAVHAHARVLLAYVMCARVLVLYITRAFDSSYSVHACYSRALQSWGCPVLQLSASTHLARAVNDLYLMFRVVLYYWGCGKVFLLIIYRISSKSCRGEILFQGPVWCGDNSRAASTEIDTHVRTQLQ